MALYTILFGISIFMIALVMAIIKKMFFHWKQEHKIEYMEVPAVERPAVSVMIYTEKCILRTLRYTDITVYAVLTKSDVSLSKKNLESFYTAPEYINSDENIPTLGSTTG